MSNLLKLLQPKDYKSKIKLYCPFNEFKINKFAQMENKSYVCKVIKIIEL